MVAVAEIRLAASPALQLCQGNIDRTSTRLGLATCLVSELLACRMRSGGSSHTSVCRSHELLVVGVSQRSDWSSLVSQLNTALGAAQARVHAQRSAASNTQGHQKTPSFIYALLLQVMQPERRRVSPEGCFTDVGLHTGGRERSTCWPLVRSVAQVRTKARARIYFLL